jgi:hypothetical protein
VLPGIIKERGLMLILWNSKNDTATENKELVSEGLTVE